MANYREEDYQMVKVFAGGDPALTGGLNEGIALYRRKKDGYLTILKSISQKDMKEGFGARESAILCSFNHPNVNRILGMKQNRIMIEYCDHGSLQALIYLYAQSKKHPPEEFVWHCLRNIAHALLYLHYGIDVYSDTRAPSSWDFVIHTDLSPANVFLMHSNGSIFPRIVLGDFGCARRGSEELKKTSEAAREATRGNAKYLPPEQYRYDRKSDVWAMGTVILDLMRMRERSNQRGDISYEEQPKNPMPYNQELLECVRRLREPKIVNRPNIVTAYKDICRSMSGLHNLKPQPLSASFLKRDHKQPSRFTAPIQSSARGVGTSEVRQTTGSGQAHSSSSAEAAAQMSRDQLKFLQEQEQEL